MIRHVNTSCLRVIRVSPLPPFIILKGDKGCVGVEITAQCKGVRRDGNDGAMHVYSRILPKTPVVLSLNRKLDLSRTESVRLRSKLTIHSWVSGSFLWFCLRRFGCLC